MIFHYPINPANNGFQPKTIRRLTTENRPPNLVHSNPIGLLTTNETLPTQLTLTAPQSISVVGRLKQLGLSEKSIHKLAHQLHDEGDTLYHAGRLLNGKTYIITAQDKVFYGWPNALHPIKILHRTRNRCIDHQIRDYTAENGLHLRIETRDQHRSAQAQTTWLDNFRLQLPHLKQVSFIEGTP